MVFRKCAISISFRYSNQAFTCWSIWWNMMTSSNGSFFPVTGPLCRKFTSHRWIPLTKDWYCGLWFFFDVGPHKLFNKQSNDGWFETTWRSRVNRFYKAIEFQQNEIHFEHHLFRHFLEWCHFRIWFKFYCILFFEESNGQYINICTDHSLLPIRRQAVITWSNGDPVHS